VIDEEGCVLRELPIRFYRQYTDARLFGFELR
jgi:hypothetical protein